MQKNQPLKWAPPARGPSRSERALRNISLSPPDYRIDPKNLLDYYIEKEITYAGHIENVPIHEDVTNRTNVLRTIDNGKKQGKIVWKTSEEHRAIFTLNVYNIKISRRHTEELVLRVATHEIAAICYVRDDKQHILALKYGDPKTGCQLAVVYCDSKGVAEEICALVGQCFQLIYTDATMQYIDQEIHIPYPHSEGFSETSTIPDRRRYRDLGFFTPSMYSDVSSRKYSSLPGSTVSSESGSFSGQLLQDYVKKPNTAKRDKIQPPSASPMLKDVTAEARKYMYPKPSSITELSAIDPRVCALGELEIMLEGLIRLHEMLTSDDLKKFAQLLKARYSNVHGLSFEEFCDQVRKVFGHNKRQLMKGLWPFIGDRDRFEEYLDKHGIISSDSGLDKDSTASSSANETTVTMTTEVVPRTNRTGTRRSTGSSGSGHSGGRARVSGDVIQSLMDGLSAGYSQSISNGSTNSDNNSDTHIPMDEYLL